MNEMEPVRVPGLPFVVPVRRPVAITSSGLECTYRERRGNMARTGQNATK